MTASGITILPSDSDTLAAEASEASPSGTLLLTIDAVSCDACVTNVDLCDCVVEGLEPVRSAASGGAIDCKLTATVAGLCSVASGPLVLAACTRELLCRTPCEFQVAIAEANPARMESGNLPHSES